MLRLQSSHGPAASQHDTAISSLMSSNPFFSVVIPTYNRAPLLQQALESVFTQECTDFEVIVVDDGSTDATLAYLESLGDRIQAVQQVNGGPGAARNLGARHARGTYIAFLDSDDLWFPWTLRVFREQVSRHGSPAILAARLVEFSDPKEIVDQKSDVVQSEAFEDFLKSFRKAYFVGAGMSVLRRDAFLETGGFSTNRLNAEDHDLILRMGTATGFVQILTPVTLAWRRHPQSETADCRKTFEGTCYLIEQELAGKYPGGAGRASERREIISRHARPTALECLRRGRPQDGWRLYRLTSRWHVALRRWRFLLGFPLQSLLNRA
jgi:GT2 family glycosyltransferase